MSWPPPYDPSQGYSHYPAGQGRPGLPQLQPQPQPQPQPPAQLQSQPHLQQQPQAQTQQTQQLPNQQYRYLVPQYPAQAPAPAPVLTPTGPHTFSGIQIGSTGYPHQSPSPLQARIPIPSQAHPSTTYPHHPPFPQSIAFQHGGHHQTSRHQPNIPHTNVYLPQFQHYQQLQQPQPQPQSSPMPVPTLSTHNHPPAQTLTGYNPLASGHQHVLSGQISAVPLPAPTQATPAHTIQQSPAAQAIPIVRTPSAQLQQFSSPQPGLPQPVPMQTPLSQSISSQSISSEPRQLRQGLPEGTIPPAVLQPVLGSSPTAAGVKVATVGAPAKPAPKHGSSRKSGVPAGSAPLTPSKLQPLRAPAPIRRVDTGATNGSGTPKLEQRPKDHSGLLLALADEYISTAHHLATKSSDLSAGEMDEYNKLITTGLGCLDIALKKFRHPAPVECRLRLKYATVLFAETESWYEIESTLSKGVVVCERNKLVDMKYAMQHLLVRVLFKTHPRAALKAADKHVTEAELYGHVPWIYAFRFLRACLSGQTSDPTAAVHQLRAAREIAIKKGDIAIVVATAAFEAMMLLQAKSVESGPQIQQAIAVARSHQLDSTVSQLQQVWSMVDVIDLAAALQLGHRTEAKQKLAALQEGMDLLESTESGILSVPVTSAPSNGALAEDSFGVFTSVNNILGLAFSWLRSDDMVVLGYYLSGLTMDLHNMNDARAAAYLGQAVGILSDDDGDVLQPQCLGVGIQTKQWRNLLLWHIRLHQALSACRNEDWTGAADGLAQLQAGLADGTVVHVDSAGLARSVAYLEGVIDHGIGHLDRAIAAFTSPLLGLGELVKRSSTGPTSPPSSSRSSGVVPLLDVRQIAAGSDPHVDLRLLSALHVVLASGSTSPPTVSFLPADFMSQFDQLDGIYTSHPNRSISTAYYLVRCITAPAGLTGLKNNLQVALRQAKEVSNNQLLLMCLALLCSRFAVDMDPAMAEKTAVAVRHASVTSKVWTAVSSAILGRILTAAGRHAEADELTATAAGLIDSFPDRLRQRLQQR